MVSRYQRQLALDEIGEEGQEQLEQSRVVVVGVGALGCVTAQLLVRAGIGTITLIDHDKVETVNLQRQLLYDETDVGKKKVQAAKNKLQTINSTVTIETEDVILSEANKDVLNGYDMILDCTDNMKTRHVINDAAQKYDTLWIYAAGSRTEGNIWVVDEPTRFKTVFNTGETFDKCSEVGVINTLTTVMASLQTTECLKYLIHDEYCSDLIRFNLWQNTYKKLQMTE